LYLLYSMRFTRRPKTYTLIQSKSVFTISLIVTGITILGVYFWGLGTHRTLYENSIISTTILSIAFFSFLAISLYRGVKLKDNLGIVNENYRKFSLHFEMPFDIPGTGAIEAGAEGCGEAIISFFLWIFVAIAVVALLWVFGNILIIAVMAFIAMLYWIFFRALRLVFKNSNKSKGDLMASMKTAVLYTVLYNFWIYGILVVTHYLKHP
jgi:hypothetical protein